VARYHDSPTVLFRLACEHLICARVIRPGVVKLIERAATARESASEETFDRVVHLLPARRQVDLDELLVVDDTVGSTRLARLGNAPTEASASAVRIGFGRVPLRALRPGGSLVACSAKKGRYFLSTARCRIRRAPSRPDSARFSPSWSSPLLGHRDPRTTARYARVVDMARANPAAAVPIRL
jgi:hypothetical protein